MYGQVIPKDYDEDEDEDEDALEGGGLLNL